MKKIIPFTLSVPKKNKSSTSLVFYGTEGVSTNGDMKY